MMKYVIDHQVQSIVSILFAPILLRSNHYSQAYTTVSSIKIKQINKAYRSAFNCITNNPALLLRSINILLGLFDVLCQWIIRERLNGLADGPKLRIVFYLP